MGNFGMELVLGGKDTLSPVMKNAEEGYKRLEATARKSMGGLAETAQRASLRVTTVAQTAQQMSSSYTSASSEMARASSTSDLAMTAATRTAEDYALALDVANSAGSEYASALEDQARAAEESALATKLAAESQVRAAAASEDYGLALEAARIHGAHYVEGIEQMAATQALSMQAMSGSSEAAGSRISRVFGTIRSGAVATASTVRSAFVGAAVGVATTMSALEARVQTTMTGIQAAVGEAGLRIFKSQDEYEKFVQRVSRGSEEMQRRVTRAVQLTGTALVGLATGAVIIGASFEQSMAKVGAATNATPAQLVMMSNEALKWGTTTRYSAKEVAEAMALIGAETGNTSETIRTIGPVIKLAGGTMISLAESTGIVAQAMDAYNLRGADAAHISNVLAAGANAGSTGMASMAQAFNGVSADAGAAGLTLEQTVAMLAAMTAHGVPAGQAMSALRTIIAQTQNPSDKLREAMGGLTVQGDGMWSVLQKLISTGPGLTALFGDARKFSGLAALQKEGVAGLQKYIEAVTGTNAAEAKFAANQNNVATQWAIFINQVKGQGIRIFQELSGSVSGTLQEMQAAVQRWGDKVLGMVIIAKRWASEHKEQIEQVLRLAVVIGGLVAVLSVVATATIKTVAFFRALHDIWIIMRIAGLALGPICTAVAEGLLGIVTTIAGAIGAGPLLLAAIGAALVGIVVHLYRTNDAFREWVHNLIEGAKSFARDLLDHLTWPFRKWLEYASKAMSFLGDLFPGMREKVNAAMSWVSDKAGSAWSATSSAAQSAFNTVKNGAVDLGRSVSNSATTMANNVKSAFTGIVPDVSKMFDDASAVGRKAAAQREFAAAGNPRLAQFQAQAYQNALSNPDLKNPGSGNSGGAAMELELRPHLAQDLLLASFAQVNGQWDATLAGMTDSSEKYTTDWLQARMAQIDRSYQQEIQGANVTAEQIATARVARENAIGQVIMQNQDAVAAHRFDVEQASIAEVVAANATGTKAWLDARTQQINLAYDAEVAKGGMTATELANARISREQQIHDARMQFQQAYMDKWIQDNQLQVAAMQGVGAAYDSLIEMMINKDNDHERRRRILWESFKRTFITGVSNMFKHWVTETIKAHILSDAVQEKSAARQKLTDAKAGAVAAYHAFAGVPLVGPALGAAAAAAAFSFLMAFNQGGLVPRYGPNRDTIPAMLSPGEFVMRRGAVDKIGTETLEYANRTGQLRDAGGVTFAPTFHIQGSRAFVDEMTDFIDREIIPRLEDAAVDGRLRVSRRAIA